jgi:GDP-4-dehydro-6-deoxy-D-mannose reductase
MRSLITGISGFAGGHLATELLARDAQVAGLDRGTSDQLAPLLDRIEFCEADVRDGERLGGLAEAFRPDTIFHLAALTHVAQAWEQRRATLEINVLGTATVLEVAAGLDPKPRVVLASSGQVYGARPADSRPLTEEDATTPQSPYAVSKRCAELLAEQVRLGDGVQTVILRTFNYTGPWQSPSFVCSDFARQIARAEAGLQEPVITVGNLDAARDFSDVRDIVRGYLLAAKDGEPGRVYNLCSGEAVPIVAILDHLRAASRVDIRVVEDPERLRRADLRVLLGDASRARRELGWEPRFRLAETLDAVLDFWRQRTAREA